MIGALLKKQMMELFSFFFQNKKTGKKRSIGGMIGYGVLYLYAFGVIGAMFFLMANALCAPLIRVELGWLYMALMGLVGIVFGVFGSVFSTYNSLYNAKDNDMLLSMPIPSSKILLVRLSGVYIMGLLYESIVMVPTIIVYFLNVKLSFLSVLFTLLIPFVLSFLVLTLSCILGFAVAAVSARMKHKNLITMVLSLGFLVAYFYIYSKAYTMLQMILTDAERIGNKMKTVLFPVYHMGRAAEGNILSMILFTLIFSVLFGIVYWILSHSFLKLATANKGAARVKYKENKILRSGSVKSALLKKEFRRFMSSPTYMLNCGLGLIMMVIAAVFLFIKGRWIYDMLSMIFVGESAQLIPLFAVALLGMVASTNDITAPSVSLEGKHIWLLQAYPVPPKEVLYAKLKLHLILTVIPTLLLCAALLFAIRPTLWFAVLIPIEAVLFVILGALWGLFLNLKMPNLNWTNETVPVKQSLAVMLALFGGWIMIVALGALYALVAKWVTPLIYLGLAAILLSALSVLLFRWIQTKGAKIFERL